MKTASTKKVEKILLWLLDNYQESRSVTIGCKTCKEKSHIMAATAYTAWLPFHDTHEIWIKNPFTKNGDN